tara:strand:+ start:531 stop:632 length:102 start_codon:yes stop_codon:yes gene_type:complete
MEKEYIMDILFFTGMVFWGMYLNANEDIDNEST